MYILILVCEALIFIILIIIILYFCKKDIIIDLRDREIIEFYEEDYNQQLENNTELINEICSICLEEIIYNNNQIYKVKCCNKYFHTKCLNSYIIYELNHNKIKIICPNCRRDI